MPIPDVQSERDERRLAIDQVGIKGLRYPLPFADRDGVVHATIATCNVYVALPEDAKGTHMSRLVALLEERALPDAAPLTVASLRAFVDELVVRLERPAVASSSRFRSSCARLAPVSGVASLLDYDVRLTASSTTAATRARSASSCRSRRCARARRKSPTTARTTSARS